MENLDCMHEDDLMNFWSDHHTARRSSRMLLFGRAGRGTRIACRDVANYAANKATAMRLRLKGDIAKAMEYEDLCDRLYKLLPDYARW